MRANPWRGEVELQLEEKTYVLRPTFAALSRVEQACGSGLITLAKKISQGTLTLQELSVIIRECAISNIEIPEIERGLIKDGLVRSLQAVSSMLALVFGGFDA